MTRLDLALQAWRVGKARPYLPAGGRVLDIGTGDGALFRRTGATGVGIDPELPAGAPAPPGVRLIRGQFPPDSATPLPEAPFEAAVALAVVEHVPDGGLDAWVEALECLLVPGGVLVLTVPSPLVDRILHVLMAVRLVDGMQAHEHHGFVPSDLHGVFASPRWELVRHRRFQLGLNNLFVFRLASRG
jgi:SAM-dependent methyltransferase